MAKYTNRYGKQIGKGTFSKVFKKDGEDFVTIISDDWAKECASFFGLGDSYLFPSVERLDDPDNWSDLKAYRMEYFPKVSSLKNALEKDQHELYLVLRKIALQVQLNASEQDWKNLDKYLELFAEMPAKFLTESNALIKAIDQLTNYGCDMRFEISPRNVAVKDGKLILLDCFFFKSQLLQKRRAKNKNF